MTPTLGHDPLFQASKILSVTELAGKLRSTIRDAIPVAVVRGEITGIRRPSSGHVYFTLRDEFAVISAVLWRSTVARVPFELSDGLRVIVTVELDFYGLRGQLQVLVNEMIPDGLGPLELALKQLRDRLESQGLFSVERKRPLPMFPKRVAVVTSPQAAALRDFLEVAGRRWRSTEIVLVPSLVQGDQAPRELIAGLQKAASLRPDVIALVRGGGSLEDLWAFNNEALAHAIFASPIPVVVGVGHETDVTIADLVADVRALTPSQAAELIFPDRHAFQLQLAQIRKRLTQACVNIVARAWQRWQWAARTHSIREPLRHVQVYSQRLDELERRMVHSILRTVETSDRKLKSSSKELDALNPRRVLERGYAWVTAPSTGRVVTHSDQVQQGDVVLIHLFQGELRAEVQDVQEKSW